MNLRTGLKVASFSILVLLVLAVSLIVTLMYSDPTRLKEQIEALARQQGLELELAGDIGWSIFPNIQFIARDATATYTASSMQLDAEFDYLNFALKPLPALRGELEFVGAEVSGAVLNLQLREMGASEDGLEKSMEDASVLLPPAKIAHLQLTNVTLNLVTAKQDANESAEQISVQIHNLDARDLASDGEPFAVKAELELDTLPMEFGLLEFEGHLLVEPQVNAYAADFRQLFIRRQHEGIEHNLEGDARFNLDLNRNQWSGEINLADQGVAGLKANYAGSLSPVAGAGRVEFNLSDLGTWRRPLGVADDQSLLIKMLALDTDIILDETLLQLENLRVRADENSGKGNLLLGIKDPKTLEASLTFDQLDLTPYLASDSTVDQAASESDDARARVRKFSDEFSDLVIELNANRLTLADREVEGVHLMANFKDGVGDLVIPSARFAGGEFSLSLSVDLAEIDRVSDIQMNVSGLQLEELDIGSPDAVLGGALDLSYQGALVQLPAQDLVRGLQGRGRINLTEFAVRNMNIERTLCETVELLGATPAAATSWLEGTVLGNVASDYVIRNGGVTIDEFDFIYGNMEVVGKSDLNLVDLDYDVRFTVEVNDTKTSANGCNLNKYAQGIPLPLQCAGSLGADGQQSCGVDTDIAERLALRQVGDRLIDGLLDRVVEDESSESQEAAQDESASDERNQLRSILEGLLRNIDN